ncbi:glycosyltransferase family 4 protein [Edaphobacter sp.]|uniref:glycosyltransferase family 4 protein n=1 Tax=Edaphobacter sp. TaxID=1934404 RepID=UPI002DB93274|nr:glycosyltransferase family 4 protein [Edaphobacter sp.]HEU5339970.1 glycosyltransferase family 4 protein [Edaphobacter sp.]
MPFLPEEAEGSTRKKVRLAYLVSHPIQYQAPLLRRIAQEQDIEMTVLFGSNFSVKGYQDDGFGVDVKWDVPLLDGYRHEFLPVLRDGHTVRFANPLNYGIWTRLRDGNADTPASTMRGFDALWVHGYITVNALHGILAAKSLGIPVLVRAESWLRDRSRNGLKLATKSIFFTMLKGLIDGVLPVGTLNAEYWSHYLGDAVPQSLMPYAVDNDYFQRRSRQAQSGRSTLLAELKLEPARPVILFASKLQRRKRCADLLEAYLRLSPAPGIAPHPYLLIVGDGEERAALERRAAESGFDSIRFCGFKNQSELPSFFDIASIFVLPSQHEPWGLVVNEVMNAGRAVIVSDDVGCAPDLITDGVEGCVFPVGDIDALTGALRRVLASPETAAAMGQRALEKIQRWGFEEDVRGLRQALAKATGKIGA